MELRSIAFKWSIELPLDSALVALAQVGLLPNRLKQYQWSRSLGDHQLQVEHRPILSTKERSFFWLRWVNPKGNVEKANLDRPLSEWFFAMSQYAETNVNWLQVVVDLDVFQPPLGYRETSPKIWTKEEKQHRFSFYPVPNHYYFEVRNRNDRKTIQHQRFSFWLDELKHHVLGHERPDDQIMFDIVV
ncbi:hypothetical protein [Paenibacillus ihuae]|uniref:hypothetical protein n=1 Tax=Paenibacillus ihuae TaxID=1232431 RepID=UPI0006D59239|nr:hypothetical protein [Paenibacillus ihuae]